MKSPFVTDLSDKFLVNREFYEAFKEWIGYCPEIKLLQAIENGDYSLIKLSIAAGADIETHNCKGKTPLRIAIEGKNWPAAKLLIEKGANRYALDEEGNTIMNSMRLDGSKEATEIFTLLHASFSKQAPK